LRSVKSALLNSRVVKTEPMLRKQIERSKLYV
jgi:hypothetical protein